MVNLLGRNQETICYDNLGERKKHGPEQRYVSPTTGVCRKLVVQAVKPSASEVSIEDHTSEISKLALWLVSNNPVRGWIIFIWIYKWLLFSFKLLWSLISLAARLYYMIYVGTSDSDADDEGSGPYNTGYYKPYVRAFRGQLWAARSAKEYSSRTRAIEKETNVSPHTPYPDVLMILNKGTKKWERCTDRETIIRTRFIAISYLTADALTCGSYEGNKTAQFMELWAAVLSQGFEAYWLDIECIGETQAQKDRDLYCMADVYRGADLTLIMLGNVGIDGKGEDKCWKDWGKRVWAMPEALLSTRLCYKFRDHREVGRLSLQELANLAYSHHDVERTIINAYSRNGLLEKMDRLTLLKSAMLRGSTAALTNDSTSPPPEMAGTTWGAYKAERVYALMGFFEHRIQPTQSEDDQHALVRLYMANDKDRIVERMASMLPSKISPTAHWDADDDIYDANLWDIVPEIQVAGVTENRALVLDGCRAAAIRWKDFPEVAVTTPDSVRRTVIGCIPYLSWPVLIAGLGVVTTNRTAEMTLITIGIFLLLISPSLLVFSRSGRIASVQPWFIGVKGVINKEKAEEHLYGGSKGHLPRVNYTPSGSEFSTAEEGQLRGGSLKQHNDAEAVMSQQGTGQVYTLIDTYSSMMYYFRAERPPTVCIFTGREGGLGRFVLCSERCGVSELHKESVLRMPTWISDKMEMCDWIALG